MRTIICAGSTGSPSAPTSRRASSTGRASCTPDLAFTLRFPDGWETANTPQAVAGLAPDRRMQIVLELAAEGRDLAGAAAAFEERAGRSLAIDAAGPVRVAGRDAFRLRGSGADGAQLISTFLHHRDLVFQLSCVGFDPHAARRALQRHHAELPPAAGRAARRR